MQAVGHMVAEVDACQRALAEVLCIHNLHGTLTTFDSYNAEYKGLSPEGVVLVCLEGQAMQAIGHMVAEVMRARGPLLKSLASMTCIMP